VVIVGCSGRYGPPKQNTLTSAAENPHPFGTRSRPPPQADSPASSTAAPEAAPDRDGDTHADQGLLDWLLARLLSGRPVQQQTAATAYRKFKADG
jgi:hypothetical protein